MERKTDALRESIAEKTAARVKREIGDKKEGGWVTDRSTFAEYENHFQQDDLGQLDLRERLVDLSSLTVVDLMAPTNALVDLFGNLPQTNKLGISVSTLRYHRTPEQRAFDRKHHIYPVAGDLLKPDAWEKIDKRLKDRRVDLFVERAGSGIAFVPLNRDLYNIAARLLWQRLNPNGGIILAQTPSFSQFAELDVDMYAWTRELNDRGVGAKYFGGGGFLNNGKILIQRFPYSPTSLPRL